MVNEHVILQSHCADFDPSVLRIVNPWPSVENRVESQQHRGHTLAIRDHSLVILDESWQFGKSPGGFKMFKTTVVNREIISICDKPWQYRGSTGIVVATPGSTVAHRGCTVAT